MHLALILNFICHIYTICPVPSLLFIASFRTLGGGVAVGVYSVHWIHSVQVKYKLLGAIRSLATTDGQAFYSFAAIKIDSQIRCLMYVCRFFILMTSYYITGRLTMRRPGLFCFIDELIEIVSQLYSTDLTIRIYLSLIDDIYIYIGLYIYISSDPF